MSDLIIVNNTSLEKTFDDAAPLYDPNGYFKVHGRRLVDLLPMKVGVRVLDIATGSGAVLLPAARKTGPDGRVIGIDISESMLERTKQTVEAEGIENVELIKMDGGRLNFKDASFDMVMCGFGIFFLPVTGLNEMYRVCKPGGILGLTVFGKSGVSEIGCKEVFEELTKEYGVLVEYTMPLPAYYTPDEIRSLLSSYSFGNIKISQDTTDTVYTDLEEYWKVVLSAGNRMVFMNMEVAKINRFKSELFERLKMIMKPDGLHQQSSVIYIVSEKSI
jgi:ubiquinone/menaquinone biosynthesis C-methylase UbiE